MCATSAQDYFNIGAMHRVFGWTLRQLYHAVLNPANLGTPSDEKVA